jgi:Tfp pilus assembly protein PilV
MKEMLGENLLIDWHFCFMERTMIITRKIAARDSALVTPPGTGRGEGQPLPTTPDNDIRGQACRGRRATRSGFTLVEAMVAASVTVIVALGTLGYQYYSVKHSRASQAQIMATRIGQLLLEDWKSTSADDAYDPTTLGLGFLSPEPGEGGQYLITLENQTFYVQLIRSDVAYDPVANVTLRQVNVTVQWRTDYSRGPITVDDPAISLTTYVRCDGKL